MGAFDNRIRVGQKITNLDLGEFAQTLDAMHEGFVASSIGTNSLFPVVFTQFNTPTLLSNPVKFNYSNGFNRKPPYLVVATINLDRAATSRKMQAWIIRTPTFLVGNSANWVTEVTRNSSISNIEGLGVPDAEFTSAVVDGSYQGRTVNVMKLFTDDLSQSVSYTDGVQDDPYDQYFYVALAIDGGNLSDGIQVNNFVMSLFGGR